MRATRIVHVSWPYIIGLFVLFAPGFAAAQKEKEGIQRPTVDAQQTLAIQVGLDRAGFSPGEIDGRIGAKTRLALAEFQKSANLQSTGAANEETLAALQIPAEPVVVHAITPQDVAGPFIGKMPGDMMESAKLQALGYATPLEALAERFHSSQALLTSLNPSAQWEAGETIRVPNVEPFDLPTKGSKPAPGMIEVHLSGSTKSLVVRDAAGKVLMYAPVTIGSEKDPLPVGNWKVVGVSWNPVFNYNPDLFWDADPTHAKAKIPAGPNNPVGVVWVDINKEHFGFHGTPEPSTVGRTESHGCVRLTNWDATKLGRLVNIGTPIVIVQ
jgi:lipoprotein-anchoring transpeptidase ErfK/SrfK